MKNFETKLKVIEEIKKGKKFIDISREISVSTKTISRWHKIYLKEGIEGLKGKRKYNPPWNIIPDEIKEKVYLLKEKTPGITLLETQKKLKKLGIYLSLGCIRKIWYRYGFIRDRKINKFEIFPSIYFQKDVKLFIEEANKAIEKNDFKRAAKILNRLPYCYGEEILGKIPWKYLNLRRKVEKIGYLFGKEPLKIYYKKIKKLRKECEKNSFFYSAWRLALIELNTLFWMGKMKSMLNLIKYFEQKIPIIKDKLICFSFSLLKGITYAKLLKSNEALKCAKKCHNILKNLKINELYISLGHLYSNLGIYPKAIKCYQKAIEEGIFFNEALISLAGCYALNGEYNLALNILKKLKGELFHHQPLIYLIKAQCLIGKGKIIEAIEYTKRAIETSKKEEIIQYLHSSTLLLSTIYAGLNKRKNANLLLKKMLPVLKKSKMIQQYYIRKMILANKIYVPKKYQFDPFIKLTILFKKIKRLKDYNLAFSYATKNCIKGYFQRLCVLNYEIIENLYKKYRLKGLPKSILKLPIFNEKTFIFNIKFLGKFNIYTLIKQKEYKKIKSKFSLKEKSLLLYISLKLPEPGRSIQIDEILKNFWGNSKNPKKNLLRTLSEIKKKLKIPFPLLEIPKRGNFSILKNNGIYFLTDYNDFEENLIKAKSFLKAGEFEFAKKEFINAFKLIKCEPFKNMYDRFSEDKRTEIIFKIKDAYEDFLKTNPSKKEIEKIEKKFEKLKILIK